MFVALGILAAFVAGALAVIMLVEYLEDSVFGVSQSFWTYLREAPGVLWISVRGAVRGY